MTRLLPLDIRRRYSAKIEEITSNPDYFADKVIDLADFVTKEFENDAERNDAISFVIPFMYENFQKIPSKLVTAPMMLSMLEGLFGKGAPFFGFARTPEYPPFRATSLIAAEHYLATHDPEGIFNFDSQKTRRYITFIAFEGKSSWKSLRKALADLDGSRGSKLQASMPYFIENMHELCSTSTGASLQKMGGVARVKEIGADLDKICQAVLTGIRKPSENHAAFPFLYDFLKTAIEDLKSSHRISQAEANARYTALLDGVLHTQSRPVNHKHKCWSPMVDELRSYARKDLDLESVIHLARLSTKEELSELGFSLEANGGIKRFRSILESKVQPSERYQVIDNLGLKSNFSREELLQFSGKRIECDLGL